MLVAIVRNLQGEIPYLTASTRERERREKNLETAEKTPCSSCRGGVLRCGCLKRNWAEWGRDVFWPIWPIPHQVWVFFSRFFLLFFFSPYTLPLTESSPRPNPVSTVWAYFGSCGVILGGGSVSEVGGHRENSWGCSVQIHPGHPAVCPPRRH